MKAAPAGQGEGHQEPQGEIQVQDIKTALADEAARQAAERDANIKALREVNRANEAEERAEAAYRQECVNYIERHVLADEYDEYERLFNLGRLNGAASSHQVARGVARLRRVDYLGRFGGAA